MTIKQGRAKAALGAGHRRKSLNAHAGWVELVVGQRRKVIENDMEKLRDIFVSVCFTSSVIDGSAKAASDALLHWVKEKAAELFSYFLGEF